MKRAIITKLDENHFEYMANEMEKYYDPFSFLFIGPTGYYVRQISDKFSEKLGKTINRDAFRVINQYVVETLKLNNMDAVFFDRDFFKAFIASQIEEYIKNEKDDEYLEFLRTVSRSKGILSYILELFEKAWEIKVSNGDFLTPYYYEINQLLEKNEKISKLILNLLNDTSLIMQKSGNIFEQITTYKWYVEEYFEEKKKNLVLSGFFDIPPILKDVFKKMFKNFENVYFYVWEQINDRAFNQLNDIYNFLKSEGFKIEETIPHTLKLKDKTKVISYKNSIVEIYEITGKIKELLINGKSPNEIAIVVPNFSIAKQFSEKLTEIGIPNNVNLQSKFSESKIVKILLQPIKTIYYNFETEDLLALIESPYIDTRQLTIEKIEKFFREFRMLDEKFSKEKIQEISAHIKQLEEIKDDDTYQDRMEKIEEYKVFIEILDNLLNLLEEVKTGINNDFITWFIEFIKFSIEKFDIFTNDKYLFEIKEEKNALIKFIEVLNNLKSYNLKINSWRTFYKILTSIINVEKYRFSERKENAIDIFDITQARFVRKKFKFFVNFIDAFYPNFDINPLILNVLSDPNKLRSFNEEVERRNVILSLIFSENNHISFPHSTLSGEPILPSTYATEFGEVKNIETSFYIIPQASKIYSEFDKNLYKAFNDERKLKLNVEWKSSLNVKKVSHSLISTYVNCPFKLFLSEKANVRNIDSDKSNLYIGIFYHRVLKRYFEEVVFELKKLVEEVYDEVFTEEFFQYSIPKSINIENYTKKLNEFLMHLHENVESKNIYQLEKTYMTKLRGNILAEARIDRIDKDKDSYTIIDYKKNSKNSDMGQLLLYDYIFKSNINKDFETTLLFLGIEDRKSYKIKRIKEKIYYNYYKSEKEIDYDIYLSWLDSILEKLTSGDITPIFVEQNNVKPFMMYLKDMGFKIQNKKRFCKSYAVSCHFYEICKNFEIYNNVKLVEK
ncbi:MULTISPECIES: PD-(D/E)XK nuclease family protein [unclassified Thermosipho (in: thermotogales)]|uniref:PD-(D/E)XK nuclease family protein n=1 Tax=unclassified Thermosipho (in: thermotogales) TaxID=2676525 RepID=UPI0009865B1B|nr:MULTISPECIES: PD-(D/E)XK nuclease family protein [unclassified Thermosipho (in: thermotogales)]MBT1247267.1 hypothetical protein [Thermosipho sp. 1244]OOC47122.1 hypothetical protein XO09_02890 [Thermosipho sp. 1223]